MRRQLQPLGRQLQPLLRASDSRIVAEAVRALAQADDPSAPRMLHTLLKSASGLQRAAIVATLMEQPDRRATPMLIQVLDDSVPLGDDHPAVLDTLRVLERLGDERAIESIERVMLCRSWFRRKRARAVKQAAVAALLRIESPRAKAVLSEAHRAGDRLLRVVAREMAGAVLP